MHLVGGGPGDPGLLTLRAARLLSSCTLAVHDRLAPREALDLLPTQASRVAVGKRPGGGWTQTEVDRLLVGAALGGHAVVRLKGGDPFVLGRGGEELAACRAAGVPVEVVPGVTAAVAAPAAAGIPLTHRGVASGFAVVTGRTAGPDAHTDDDLAGAAGFPGTLVVLMGIATIRRVVDGLLAHGREPTTPVAVVRSATTPHQQVLRADLGSVAAEVERAGLTGPATIVVGEVVRLGDGLDELSQPVGARGRGRWTGC